MFENRYDGLVGFFGIVHNLEGRKKLQKSVYLAKEYGFPGLRERFDFHWYGPYSEMLANEVQELVQLGVLDEQEQKAANGFLTYSYQIDESVFEYFQEQVTNSAPYRPLLSRIVKEDSRFLELAATLHYFLRNGYDRDQAECEVMRVKSEKKYSPNDMQQAWKFLDELNTIGRQVSESL